MKWQPATLDRYTRRRVTPPGLIEFVVIFLLRHAPQTRDLRGMVFLCLDDRPMHRKSDVPPFD